MADFTEEQIKAALIRNNSWNGSGVLNTPLKNLTYSFGDTEIPYWKGVDYFVSKVKENTFQPLLSPGQRDAFVVAVNLWKSIANIDLNPGTPYTVTIESTTLSFGDIVIVGGKLNDGILGSTISPTSTRSADSAGDIVIGNTGSANTDNNLLDPGQTGLNTFIHELGHALGLDHPVDVDNSLPFDPGQRYTVMSYQPVAGIPGYAEWWASKPMLYDILAMQTLYGVNPNTAAGSNDTYNFKTGADAVQAIWDANGTGDTISAFDQSRDVTIDLQPGHFSFVGNNEETSQQQIAIAYQVTGQENNWIENAIGGGGNDKLIGNNADNQLSGGEGQDTMLGGSGNDTYLVDDTGDVVIENANEGSDDKVRSSVTYTLGGNVETLILTGTDTDALDGTGNALNNTLTGNNAANTLDGGSGADTLDGGAGDDVYVVDNTGDVVIESANKGTDTVRSLITYTLGENVEKLILTGTRALDGTGNAGNNTLTGNDAANTLDGGAGYDTLIGGIGNDILHGDDGAGGDILDGGVGYDTYYADEGDTIRDSR